MTILKADSAAISAAAASLRSDTAQIDVALDTLTVRLNVLASQWSGEARDAYVDAQHEWLVTMARMTAILDGAADTLDGWANTLVQIERQLAASWP